MEATEMLVRTWIVSGRDQEIEETVSAISSGQTTLLDIVKALGEYLTAEEDGLRTKGVEFLSAILVQCPHDRLNRQAARVLMTFYCSKLDDTETIVPALKGLAALVSFPTSTSSDGVEIIRALFTHVKMKALVQSTRFFVFSLIDTCMARHRDALRSLGHEFLAGYTVLAEGEKDPRNLLMAFAIAKVILIEFNVANHIESLFNITFCYFPITFRPPPNDPYGISPEDLRTALRGCLSATPAFGPLAIPVFLEKLTAGSPSIKRDTLQTMCICIPVYGPTIARESSSRLWSSLKLEVFQPTDSITEEEALKTVQVLVKTIYADGGLEQTEEIEGFGRDACEECIQILKEPEKSLAKPAVKILCTFMSTTPSVFRYTLSKVVDHLVQIFCSPDEISSRPAVLRLLSEVIEAANHSSVRASENDVGPPLMQFKDEVLGVVTAGLKNVTTVLAALDCIKGLLKAEDMLSDEEVAFVVHSINDVLRGDPGELGDASDGALDILSVISSFAPWHVKEQVLPMLFGSLPDQAPAREASIERVKYWKSLSALSRLCSQSELFENLIIRLTTKLDLICAPTIPVPADVDMEPSAAYAHSILKTIADTLDFKVGKKHLDVPKYVDRLVPRLYNLFIYSALVPGAQSMVATDSRLITVAAHIISLVTETLSLERQQDFAMGVFFAYLTGAVKEVTEGHQKISDDMPFRPLDTTSTTCQKNLMALFAAAIVPLRKEVRVPLPDTDGFLDMVIMWSLNWSENDIQREAAWQIVSSIVNKRTDDISLFLPDNMEKFWRKQIVDTEAGLERRRHAVRIWFWITKSLLVRNHPASERLSDRLFEVFDDEGISWDAARALGELGGPDPTLTKRHHAVTKILYPQKHFYRVLPRIVEGAKLSAHWRQPTAHLVALTTLIKTVPKTSYLNEMPTLMPLLIRGFDLADSDIRADIIDALTAVTEDDTVDQSVISEHVSSLATAMLKNCTATETSSTRVRIAALRYLAILPKALRYDVLHPHKPHIIRELGKVLDDSKRSVRKEAVDARTNWFKCSG